MRITLPSALLRVALAAVVLAPSLGAQQVATRLPVANVPSAPAIRWDSAAPIPGARDHHVTFITSGTRGTWLHVVGGHASGTILATAYQARFAKDGSIGAWERGDSLPTAHAGMALATDPRYVLLAGGRGATGKVTPDIYLATVWSDGRLGAWKSPTYPLPAPRFHAAAVIHDGYAYVIGGMETTTATTSIYRAKIGRGGELSAWTALEPLPSPRSHHAAFVRDGNLYLVAGNAGNPAGDAQPLADVIRAPLGKDGAVGAWTTVSTLDSTFATHAAVVHDDHLYVIGGVENNRRFSDRVIRAPFQADGSLGSWETVDSPLPAPRAHVHQIPVFGGRLYSVGGSVSGKPLPDVVIGAFAKARE